MRRMAWLRGAVSDTSLGYAILRIYLGIGLFVRGALFVARPGAILELLSERAREQWFVAMAISHYVAIAHLCGGILLAIGLGTRLAAALQLPALIGALLFVHYGDGLLRAGQSFEFAALVLCMLLVFSVFGAGKLSLDNFLQRRLAEHEGEVGSGRPGSRARA